MYLFQASKYTYEPLKYTYDKLYLWGHILPHHPCMYQTLSGLAAQIKGERSLHGKEYVKLLKVGRGSQLVSDLSPSIGEVLRFKTVLEVQMHDMNSVSRNFRSLCWGNGFTTHSAVLQPPYTWAVLCSTSCQHWTNFDHSITLTTDSSSQSSVELCQQMEPRLQSTEHRAGCHCPVSVTIVQLCVGEESS